MTTGSSKREFTVVQRGMPTVKFNKLITGRVANWRQAYVNQPLCWKTVCSVGLLKRKTPPSMVLIWFTLYDNRSYFGSFEDSCRYDGDKRSCVELIDLPLTVGLTTMEFFGSFPVLVVVSDVWTTAMSASYSSSLSSEWILGWRSCERPVDPAPSPCVVLRWLVPFVLFFVPLQAAIMWPALPQPQQMKSRKKHRRGDCPVFPDWAAFVGGDRSLRSSRAGPSLQVLVSLSFDEEPPQWSNGPCLRARVRRRRALCSPPQLQFVRPSWDQGLPPQAAVCRWRCCGSHTPGYSGEHLPKDCRIHHGGRDSRVRCVTNDWPWATGGKKKSQTNDRRLPELMPTRTRTKNRCTWLTPPPKKKKERERKLMQASYCSKQLGWYSITSEAWGPSPKGADLEA